MIKKLALGVVTLGLLFSASSVFSFQYGGGCGGCCGDICKVDSPTQINVAIGYDLKVDVDVDLCIDPGTLNDDKWNGVEAFIYQEGDSNQGYITQYNTGTQQAGIAQLGSGNYASIYQSGSLDDAMIIQGRNADRNQAYISQYGCSEDALIIQEGDYNSASIAQWASNVMAAIIQVGNGNIGSIAQH